MEMDPQSQQLRNAYAYDASVVPFHSTPKSALADTDRAAIFADPHSCQVIEQLRHGAPSDASILIAGETGTGKEVVARKIHERSGRTGPFLAVNCGALSENLGEAALFGNESGAYTGANGARPGWFEAANGGTLFLDEIGDLPLSLQVALLRVLQERQVVRLGSRKTIPIDVRVIAATNIDVSSAVSSGRFRLDLYFRLSVITLDLLSLRQRTGDVLPLAAHFIGLYSARLKRPQPRLDADAQAALLDYPWPAVALMLVQGLTSVTALFGFGYILHFSTRLQTQAWSFVLAIGGLALLGLGHTLTVLVLGTVLLSCGSALLHLVKMAQLGALNVSKSKISSLYNLVGLVGSFTGATMGGLLSASVGLQHLFLGCIPLLVGTWIFCHRRSARRDTASTAMS